MANLVIPRREIWTQQPQNIVRVSERFASRLKFAIIPNVGLVNLPGLDTPIQTTGMDKLVGKNGVSYLGGKRSEFNPTLPNANGLTLISVWRARPTSNYLSADGARCIISNRTAGNAGWVWGRLSAIGGGANGNLTAQTYAINGVAQYFESNYAIESNVDTPVACRYSQATGKISWFRFGNKSSPDTDAATSPTVGGNVVFGAAGPYSDNGGTWLDVASVVLGFVGELSDSEIYDLTKDVNSVWGAFEPRETRLFVPVGGGGTTTVTSDSAASYKVQGSVQSSSVAAYSIRSAIQSSASASYVIRAGAQNDAASTYSIRGSIQQSSTPAYLIRGLVDQVIAASYAVRGAVSSDASATYNILSASSVSASASAGYNIRGSINQGTTASYSLRGSVTQDTSATYSILSASAVSSSVTAGYAIKGSVQSSIVAGYSIAQTVQAEIAASYIIRAGAVSEAQAAYVIRGLVQQSIAASYAVEGSSFSGSISDADIARIVQAVLTALNATTIPVDMKKTNGITIMGTGSRLSPWRPA